MKSGNTALKISLVVLLISGTLPAYAEVSDLSINQRMYFLNDDILFSGKVDEGTTGLVTIVIRDTNNDFVLLTQTIIQPDETFEKKVEINNKFTTHGDYNATAFIINMTAGARTTFGVSIDGSLFTYEEDTPFIETEQTSVTSLIIENKMVLPSEQDASEIADFVDPEKDSQYYLDRYYNESAYKSWFDSNHPDMTIEEAIGYVESNLIRESISEIISDEIMPEDIVPGAEALSLPSVSTQSEPKISDETTQMALAISGLIILLGAVYGIKRKVDSNTEQISKNRDTLKKKLFGAIRSNDNLEIIRHRLAKGEITINDYNDLKRILLD